jgi:hypothetical protein
MKKLMILFIAVAGFAVSSNAQSTANAPTSAKIIAPISIAKNVDMNFGNVAVSATTAGTVILAPAGTRTTAGAGGVTLPQFNIGTVTAASFTVTGEGAYTYAITLPSGDTFKVTNGTPAQDMVVNTFTSTPSGTGALTSGTQTLTVGATLNVAAGQAVGTYTNATGFPVTVNYN